jgi:hypothetical protein
MGEEYEEEKNIISTKISSILVATKAETPIVIRLTRYVNSYYLFFLYSTRVYNMANDRTSKTT